MIRYYKDGTLTDKIPYDIKMPHSIGSMEHLNKGDYMVFDERNIGNGIKMPPLTLKIMRKFSKADGGTHGSICFDVIIVDNNILNI